MKTITIDLFNPESVRSAIKELQAEKRTWRVKARQAEKVIAEELANLINENLWQIPYVDDRIDVKTHQQVRTHAVGEARAHGNTVTIYDDEIVFIEFGAGVTHNSNGSENPLSEAVHFQTDIGSYGKGQGLQPYWFIAHNLVSKGTPMYMPIYRAIIAIKPEIPTLVRQVFV